MIRVVGCKLLDIKISMCRYALVKNYIQKKVSEKSKKIAIYIDRRSKESRNIAGFIIVYGLCQLRSDPITYLRCVREIVYLYVQ